MRKIYLLFMLLNAGGISGQDYYWVGNSGNWSDLNHWATSSGGDEFHDELPGPENNVYFDENSFTESNQIVTIDLDEVFCHDLDATGAQFNPQLQGQVYTDAMFIHGDLILPEYFGRNLKAVYLMNEVSAEIYTGGINLGSTTFFNTAGPGEYLLMDSLAVANLYLGSGTFISNNHPVNVFSRVYGHIGINHAADFGMSNVYADLWNMNSDIDLNMENATLFYGSPDNIFNEFHGGGFQYHRVVFDGYVELEGDNQYDIFEALPGAELSIEAGSVQIADQFILEGTSGSAIVISSDESGVQATFSQSNGTVDADYLVLSDNNATGGAIFNANESVDLGNNSGWNITITIPQDFYWVGGSGSWSDLSHWATTSGGNIFHETLPSAVDQVFFDANSFSSASDTINLNNGVHSCANFSMTEVPEGVSLVQGNEGVLNVYGDFMVDENPMLRFNQINMQSNSAAEIETAGNYLGNQAELQLTGGGNYQLTSPINLRSLRMESCNFNSNGHSILADFEVVILSGFSGVVDISGSQIETRIFSHSLDPEEISLENTSFVISSSFSANGLEIDQLTLEGSSGEVVSVFGSFSVQELTVLPGSVIELRSEFTVTVEDVSLEGTAEDPITIQSSVSGTAAYLSKEEGEVHGYYLILKDNYAVGGADFYAHESTILSNVEGWNILSGINDSSMADSFMLYPNPAIDKVWLNAAPNSEVVISDMAGSIHQRFTTNASTQLVAVDQLAAGQYFVSIIAQDQSRAMLRLVMTE